MIEALTGNESQHDLAAWVADAIRLAVEDADMERVRVRVSDGFQSYITVELANGAEFQVTPVRSGWPLDGTSEQFADAEDDDEGER